MFDNLTSILSQTLRNIRGHGRLTEENIKETIREVRMALLEADVALPVVREFINNVKEHAIGHKVNKSLTPGQEFIKIIRNNLIKIMGSENYSLNLAVQSPAVVLIAGLQGAGKTTSIGKLSKFLREKYRKKIIVVSTDIYRPAAIKQLEMLAQQVSVDFYPSDITDKPIDIVNHALKHASLKFYDVMIVDTSGNLNTDGAIMEEIKHIHSTINPIETLFVVDAMIGQNAANVAKAFDESLSLTGIILTKVDGDARGGAALSIRYITGKPIKFIGVGEQAEALEPFYPDRLASRILGMGDMLSLIEELENNISYVQAEKLAKKLKKGDFFNLDDFLEQLNQIRKMGGTANLLNKFSGIMQLPDDIKSQVDDNILIHMEAMIKSMTCEEREKPDIINGSRKRRIAAGSGMQIQDVNRMLRKFYDMQRMMKKIKKGGIAKILRGIK